MGEMQREIYVIDENDQEYLLKYVDEERITVRKVWLKELYKWPYTDGLKKKITEFHAEFPDAK